MPVSSNPTDDGTSRAYSVLQRLLTTSSHPEADPSLTDDKTLIRRLISAYKTHPTTLSELESMDQDSRRQCEARRSFTDFVKRANELFCMYLIHQELVPLASPATDTRLALSLRPVDAFPRMLASAGWLSEDREHDVYLRDVDVALVASDEFNCILIAAHAAQAEAVQAIATDAGLFTHALR